MSHFDHGPLATYNSLSDTHLAGYFANTRMRRHLVKSGLVSRNGVIVSEATYRLNMSRKEHKKHVKDMLAQAIVHKTLDLERTRQADIKKKLEEIAKIQLVHRVRASRGRKGDEEILPLLTVKAGRPYSSPTFKPRGRSPNSKSRPYSAPGVRPDSRFSQTSTEDDGDVLYLDDEGQPITSHRELGSKDHIDTRHLYSLDTAALRKYAMMMSQMEQGRGLSSPYLMPQVPLPPRLPLSGRSLRSARYAKSTSPQRPVTTDGHNSRLHRPESAKMHEGQQQSMCKLTMKYHGWDLHLAREQMDPTQEIQVEQQHCGGNTLTVFKERLVPGSEFSFISYRHRGYPFSLTLYVDGHVDSRVSTCCEDRHSPGAKIGGKQGHFSIICVDGAVPCYKCQVAKGVMIQNKAPRKQKKRPPESHAEEVIVVSSTKDKSDKPNTAVTRSESSHDTPDKCEPVRVAVEKEDDNEQHDKNADNVDKDNYDDDFETSGSSPLSNSRSSSESESEKTPESVSAHLQSNQKGRDRQLQVLGNDLCEEAGARLQPERIYETSHSKSRKGCANMETSGPLLQCNVKSKLSSLSSANSYSFSSSKNHKKSKAQFSVPDKVSSSSSTSINEGRKGNSLSKKDNIDIKADDQKVELITVKTVATVKEEQDTVDDMSDIESELASPPNEFEAVVDPVSDKNPRQNKTCLPRASSDKGDQEAKWSKQDKKNRSPTQRDDFESQDTSHVGWEPNEGKHEMGLKSKQPGGKSTLKKFKTVSFPEDHSQSSSRERNDAFETSSSLSSSLSSSSSSSQGFNTNCDISVENSSSSSSAAQDNDKSHNSLGGGQSESYLKLEPGKERNSSMKKRPKGKLNDSSDVSKSNSIDMEKSADDSPPLKDDFNGSLLVEDRHYPAISKPDFQDHENACGRQEVGAVDHDGPEVELRGREEFGPEEESDQSAHESIETSPVSEACQNDEEIEKGETVFVVISHEITDDNSQFHSESPLRADAKHKQGKTDDVENVAEDEMLTRLTRLANSCHDSDGAESEPVEEGNEHDGAGGEPLGEGHDGAGGEPLGEGNGHDGAGKEPDGAGTEINDKGRELDGAGTEPNDKGKELDDAVTDPNGKRREPDDARRKSDGAGSEPDEQSFQSRETEPVLEVFNSEQSRLTPVIRIDCSDEGPELPEREERDGHFMSRSLLVSKGRDHADWTPFNPHRRPPCCLAVPSMSRDLQVCERWVSEDDLAQLASCKVGPDDEKENWRCEDTDQESRTKGPDCDHGTSDNANSRDGCVKVSEEGVTVSTRAEIIKEEEVNNLKASTVETKEVRQIEDSDTAQCRDIENVDKGGNDDEDHDSLSSLSSSLSSIGESSRSHRFPISTTAMCGRPHNSDDFLGEDVSVVDGIDMPDFLEEDDGVVDMPDFLEENGDADGVDMPSVLEEDGSVVDDVVLPSFVEHDGGFVDGVDAPAGVVDPPEIVQNKETVPGGRFSPALRSRILRKMVKQETVKTMISLQDSASSFVLAGPESSDQYLPDDDNESTMRLSRRYSLDSEKFKSYDISKVDKNARSNTNGESIKIIVNDLSENQTKEIESCANKMNKLHKTFKDMVQVLHSDGTKSHMPENVAIEVKKDVSIDVENKLTKEDSKISQLAESMYFEDDGPETLILESRAGHIVQHDLGSHASDLDSESDLGSQANDLESKSDLGNHASDLDSEPDLGSHDLESGPSNVASHDSDTSPPT